MTHWVVIKHDGKIYAGADQLASGPEYPSELSATGTMSGVREKISVNKIATCQDSEGRSVVICCAGKTYPQGRTNSNQSHRIDQILEKIILPKINLGKYNTAHELMQEVIAKLNKNWVVDDNENSLLLGCGYSEGGGTIAYYDSRENTNKKVLTEYLNSSLNTVKPSIFPGVGLGAGYNSEAEYMIVEEIRKESDGRRDTVGRDATIKEINCYDRKINNYGNVISQPQPLRRSRERITNNDVIRLGLGEGNLNNQPQNQNDTCCIIS